MGLVLVISELATTSPTTAMTANICLFITRSPFKRYRNSAPVTSCCLLCGQNGITLNVNPVCRLGGDVTPHAVFLVIDRHLLVGRVGLEECPSPSITPQGVTGISILVILDHHEPDLCSRGPMCIAGSHLSVIGSEHLF